MAKKAERPIIFPLSNPTSRLQAKLLRVLQEKSYERVGEDRTRHANVRIVAATNRDLPREVAAGRFRQDFYYRLNVFPLTVAPLRDRKEDIPLLATHFIDLSVKELGCARPILTRLGVEILQKYDWPGNIRELRNVIERAVILAQGGPIALDVPVNGASIDLAALKQTSNEREEAEFLTGTEIRCRECENIFVVLQKTGWKIKGADGAARLFGSEANYINFAHKKDGSRPSRLKDSFEKSDCNPHIPSSVSLPRRTSLS